LLHPAERLVLRCDVVGQRRDEGHAGRLQKGAPALLLIPPDGTSRVLWAPTEVIVSHAIAARDGKHLAIGVGVPHASVWLFSGF
jgi:hypothetical protein